MKKILLLIVSIIVSIGMSAQVMKVYENGKLTATYANTSTDKYKVIFKEGTTGTTDGHDWVKIGGIKWATMNLGATTVAGSPSTCYGDYYAWGETEPRYTSINISDAKTATFDGWKSDHSSGYSESDYPSYKSVTLDAAHDAATQNWGVDWRTPTEEDFEALVNACTGSTSAEQNPSTLSTSDPSGGIYWLPSDQTYLPEYTGVAGILFVDKTDTSKRVFFPAAGRCSDTDFSMGGDAGYSWASSLITNTESINMFFYKLIVSYKGADNHYCGFTVRPVYANITYVTSITLDKTSLLIGIGNTKTLTPTVLPADAKTQTVTWTSSNTDVATVSSEGVVTAVAEGTATITATANDGSRVSATCEVTVPSHEYVEIAGIKWSTMNLGATTEAGSPSTCYGDYYAWSETTPRYTSITISGANSVSFGGWGNKYYKGYTPDVLPSYRGITLDAAHDAATQNWGSDWRTPTNTDFEALAYACTGSTDTQNPSTLSTSTPDGGIYWLPSDQTYLSEYTGVEGILFVDKTDTSKRVFFPAAGYCFSTNVLHGGSQGVCWSSKRNPSTVYALDFTSSDVYPSKGKDIFYGNTVRPVSGRNFVTSITLDNTLSIEVGKTKTLTPTVLPENATTPTVTWTSSNTDVATVSSEGVVTAVAVGKATITATADDGTGVSGSCEVIVPSKDYVEIGGIKWATRNLGAATVASSPSMCYGDYYAWGETEPRYTSITISDAETATFGGWSTSHSSGYSSSDSPSYTGETLDAEHDAATQAWGSDWRTPTNTDLQALAYACTGSTDTQNPSKLSTSNPDGGIYWLPSDQTYLSEYTGVAGILFVDKTDASKRVFFPSAGFCYNTNFDGDGDEGDYWSSSIYTSYNGSANNLYFKSSRLYPSYSNSRYIGFTVRPVSGRNFVTSITLDNTSLSIETGKTKTITPTVLPEYATTQTVTWTSSNTDVATVSSEGVVTAVAAGTATITATANDGGGVSAICEVTVPSQDYVEIGGVKWATRNVGATTVAGSPSTCYGDYYAWGETEPRYTSITISDAETATFGGWSTSHSSGYSRNDAPSYTGETLDADHDVATQAWGSAWRTPTKTDFEALVKACTGSTEYEDISSISSATPEGGIYWLPSDQTYLSEYTGVAGLLFVDKIDKSKRVFFPAAGCCEDTSLNYGDLYGHYWSASFYTSNTNLAYSHDFNSSRIVSPGNYARYSGITVRPVSDISGRTYVTSITLDNTSLSIVVGKTKTLTQTVLPTDATMPAVIWTSSNTDVATVSSEGVVTAVAAGTATISATANDGSEVSATCEVTVLSHDYVEIGGVKWATMNLGATTVAGNPSTCYGDYYAWGETKPRYTSITISGANSVSFGGWNSDHSSGYSKSDAPSYTDETLDADHDAATQAWGSAWCTPTKADFEALVEACTGSASEQNISSLTASTPEGGIYWLPSDQTYLSEYTGVAGLLFVDKTDTSKRVFFPAAGCCEDTAFNYGDLYGHYWSASFYTSNTNLAYSHDFSSSRIVSPGNYTRCSGLAVRPVSK